MKTKTPQVAKFESESAEADWWASLEGRKHVKHKSAAASATKRAVGSILVQSSTGRVVSKSRFDCPKRTSLKPARSPIAKESDTRPFGKCSYARASRVKRGADEMVSGQCLFRRTHRTLPPGGLRNPIVTWFSRFADVEEAGSRG
jgi:hypothetical protein